MNQAIQSAYSSRSSLLTAAAGWAQGLAGAQPRSNASGASSGGFEYSQSVTHYEAQSTSFQAQAAVTTADGRQINIDLQVKSQPGIYLPVQSHHPGGRPTRSVDPLVINFGTGSASLSEQKYAFDIDANGSLDQISFVSLTAAFWPWISMRTVPSMTAVNSSRTQRTSFSWYY